jgi:hypothetical protein
MESSYPVSGRASIKILRNVEKEIAVIFDISNLRRSRRVPAPGLRPQSARLIFGEAQFIEADAD